MGGGHFSRTTITRRLEQPTRKSVTARNNPWAAGSEWIRCRHPCSLLGLAPGGVCLARPVTRPAGELLPHRFTLTLRLGCPGPMAVCFLLHFPWPRGRWVLPTTVFRRRPDFPPAASTRREACDSADTRMATGDHPVHSEPTVTLLHEPRAENAVRL